MAQLESHLSRTTFMKLASQYIGKITVLRDFCLALQSSLQGWQWICLASNFIGSSAAFDTIDHKILLNRLSYSFGISGTVFKWFISYLTNRTQSVSVGDLNSSSLPLKYGVPQGAVLGPILFTLYSQPVSDKIREHNISYQKFADDMQLHKASQPISVFSVRFRVLFSVCEAWMLSNKLKLNDEKTKAMLVGSHQTINLTKAESIQIGRKKNFFLNPHEQSVNGTAYQPFVSFSISFYEADCIHT